ncbi:MAG: hypothetical protein WD016_07210 [Balneolaceae bacterium]
MFIISSCDSHFDPLKENERYAFSMYGTLDLHADTQWVRVMPIGEKLIPDDPEPTDVQVTLTRVSNGESIVMNDSLFRFGGDGYVWNYWVSSSLHPNEQYTVTAEEPERGQSGSVVTMPSVLPVPEVEYSIDTEGGTVSGSFTDSLIVLETRYWVQFGPSCAQQKQIIVSHLEQINDRSGGDFHFSFDNRIPLRTGAGVAGYMVKERMFFMITASKDWPYLANLNDEEVTLPDAVSNVENGTGLITGIAQRIIEITPRQPCIDVR